MYAISRIVVKPRVWCWAVAFRRRGRPYYKAFYDARRGGSKTSFDPARLARRIRWSSAVINGLDSLVMEAAVPFRLHPKAR
jgi:hypothetical protein